MALEVGAGQSPKLSGPPRLQKVLARAGIASRRHAEALIRAGRVRVNGRLVTALGARADPGADEITVDGRALEAPGGTAYLALHKPPGYLTTARDPRGRRTVMALVPPLPGLVPVGRLDADSEGLLLLTTDGEWAQMVAHPRYGCTKEYLVDVEGRPSAAALERLRRPMELAPGEPTTGAEVEVLGRGAWGTAHPCGSTCLLPTRTVVPASSAQALTRLRIALSEGRNRQIRRMLEQVGHPVRRLVRVRVGAVRLGSLAPGRWRRLSVDEIAACAPARRPA
jgi:23S rRNA pseudouridine2605 synthase